MPDRALDVAYADRVVWCDVGTINNVRETASEHGDGVKTAVARRNGQENELFGRV